MQNFLSNYIQTLTSNRQRRVADILQEATVTRDQIGLISQKLSDLTNFLPLILRDVTPSTFIASDDIMLNFRDAFKSISDLYSTSNLVSLLLDSHSAILGTDVKAIEDNLISLEKLANNYAFLLSDSGSFNYAYLEPFSDDRGRDFFNFSITDRDGTSFDDTQQASVRPTEGILTIPADLTMTHGLSVENVKSNAAAFVTSDTGINNCRALSSTTGWQTVVTAPSPVTSSIPEANGETGVQMLLEFTLTQPSPSCEIKIIPFADIAIEIVQVNLFTDDSTFIGLLDVPQIINQTFSLHFPMQAVTKFQLVLNQPVYTRNAQLTDTSQAQYQSLHLAVQKRRSEELRPDIARLQQIIRTAHQKRKNNNPLAYVSFPIQDNRQLWGPLGWNSEFINTVSSKLRMGQLWTQASDEWEQQMLGLYTNNPTFFRDVFIRSFATTDDTVTPPDSNIQVTDTKAVIDQPATSDVSSSFDYQYNLGLKYVGIGTNTPVFKGVFVSRTIPAPGDIGEVKLKAEDSNFSITSSNLDSQVVTSIEYSVSDASTPSTEASWIPILPIGSISVVGERVFFDNSGNGPLRFPANRDASVVLYKNGYNLNIDPITNYVIDNASQTITGLKLANGNFSSDDIFTCDYVPSSDYTTINFNLLNTSESPLTSAYDSSGSGEGFVGTGGRNVIDLQFDPFIDYSQVATSTYDTATGMTPYQPISVKFDDGTLVTNLTNYGDGSQTSLPVAGIGFIPPSTLIIPNDIVIDPVTQDQITRTKLYNKYGSTNPSSISSTASDASKGYYYIHSGNTLMFNQPITQSFRVFYQYLQNAVRVRVVLRVNTKNFVSPTVDAFHLKTKTRRANAKVTL